MRRQAILILGPTGSGKTPLGDVLEKKGVGASPFAHLDFGQNLRDITCGKKRCGMSDDDVAFLGEVLEEGVLLENETFHLAKKVLDNFCENEAQGADIIVLNGLPRQDRKSVV